MSVEFGTITRRMDSALNGLQEEFKSLCSIEDLEQKMEAVKAAGNRSDRSSKLRGLFDLFDLCGIKYERGKSNDYYEMIVKNSDLPSFPELEDRMLLSLFARYQDYPSPEEYMKRIVDRLCNNEDGWNSDPVRLRILKQFIKYGNYLSDAGYRGKTTISNCVKTILGRKPSEDEILSLLNDNVFDSIVNATKEQRKPNGKYGLLKLADDLANGKFRAGGATKKGLYLFAMVFGMSFYTGGTDGSEIIDYETDIEKNLFRDYYTNNLMRFISSAYKGNLSEYELDPSGQGINYKNFAEMVYLYYISKDYSPKDKVRLSAEMIGRVQMKATKQSYPHEKRDLGTSMFRGFFKYSEKNQMFYDDVFSLDETAFEEFLLQFYDCNTFGEAEHKLVGPEVVRVGPLQIGVEQRSAYKAFLSIVKGLRELHVPLENCNYGLWFTDVAAFRKKGLDTLEEHYTSIDRIKFEEFIELLLSVNRFVGYTVDETVSSQNDEQEWNQPLKLKIKALDVHSDKEITRTSLIVAYYYFFNALHENDGREKWRCFSEVFNSFKMGIDKKLEASYYQPLSGRNIFDVLVTFSSYAYLNL